MSYIFQQRPVIDTDIDAIVNAGLLSKTWLGLFQFKSVRGPSNNCFFVTFALSL